MSRYFKFYHYKNSLCQPWKEFLARNVSRSYSSSGVSEVQDINNGLSMKFGDAREHKFHYVWLRDHCQCDHCYNSVTQQRKVDTHKIPLKIKPKNVSNKCGDIAIEWTDGHTSHYKASWLHANHYGQVYDSTLLSDIKRIYWGKNIDNHMPEKISFEKVSTDEISLLKSLENIATYGFVMVSETPTTLEAIKNIAMAIGFPRQSLYGDNWLVTNQELGELDHQDSAWLNVALNGHTDGTYFVESPGLQVFHCHAHDGEGGDTLLVDAIGAAKKLKETHPDAFQFLSSTPVPARYYEDSFVGRVLGPIIKCDPYSHEIYQVRINGDDRDILSCLSYDDVERFYESLHLFMNILRDQESELWFKLTPGNCLIVNNWRVLHGRSAFTGQRTMSGCYINQDEYLSRLRLLRKKIHGITC